MSKSKQLFIFVAILLVISIACGVSFDTGGGSKDAASEVEQTLQAVYAQYTVEAMAAANANPPAAPEQAPAANQEAPAPTEITHTTIPGNPGSPDQTKDDIDTSNTAGQKIALGDSFRLGNFERPFTQDVMDYKKENDLLEILLSEDDDFYIFSLEIVGPGDDGFLSASYGIEFDSDLDGRGDVLLWAKGGDHPEWTIDDVLVLRDSNNDVGGSRPVLPDNDDGDGYDEVLFSKEVLNDPDAAWQRISPSSGNVIQLAIKKGMVGGSRFFWKGWADSGLADPAKFDYNDTMSEEQAGSPNENSKLYPIGQLNLMDSTCWVAYKYEASGKELGGCYQIVPTLVPTVKPPTPIPCPPCGNPSAIHTQSCCVKCGHIWQNGACYFKLT
jgi:hypothetical protein